jgi:nucleoside-diphosphate-sugar epimerase
MRVLIVGCGYVGLPLGAELARRGHEVFGLRRTSDGAEQLRAARIRPLTADISQSHSLTALPNHYDWVINTVASSGGDEADYRRTYLEGTSNLLKWLAPSLNGFVYTSSTGVYAQNDESIVTEESAAEPDSATSRVLIETEQLLLTGAREQNLPAMVLRCAGIYGPGRGYWLRQFLAGEAKMEDASDRWLNMIHRDDVGAAIIAVLERGRPGEIYNVVDDEPVQQRTLFAWLAERLCKPMPPSAPGIVRGFSSDHSSDHSSSAAESRRDAGGPLARRRAVTNKRVSNRKLRLALGYELKYPTFREGYAAELTRLGVFAR